LKAHPDVGLDIFHQVAQMYAAIGIGEGGGNEYFSGCGCHSADHVPCEGHGLKRALL
jgi:hypothetical protein